MTAAARQTFLARSDRWRGLTIGLLGGSFNPAHAGHLHVSREAIKRLHLDAVWWLVSPGNPLKAAAGMAPLADRLTHARAMARDPRIFVTDVESALDTRYSVETIEHLIDRHRRSRFVWLIGADNLAQFHEWRRWRDILKRLPVAVIDRPGYAFLALASPAARAMKRQRVAERHAVDLARMTAPVWTYLWIPRHGVSATALRRTAKGDWPQAAAASRRTTRQGTVKMQQQKE